MQNCLQSKTKRRIRVSFALVMAVFVSAAIAFAAKTQNNTAMMQKKDTEVMYLSNLLNHTEENMADDGQNKSQNDVKMNNQDEKVAKNEFSDHEADTFAYKIEREVRVLTHDGNVIEMPIEEYVEGCVLGEMPLSFATQALMAQCVAVRTFTVRQMMPGKGKHQNADVCTNPACCQSYISPESKKLLSDALAKLKDAALATKGIIMVYDGEPIVAVYHSSSGEYTLASEDVWGGKVEYLKSVPSPEGESAISAGGFGHRVGMSQHGANLLALQGENYMEILGYYYSGISFAFI